MGLIALFGWHTPYIWLLAKALPEQTFQVIPAPVSASGWNHTQRPTPKNVFVTDTVDVGDHDLVLTQTGADWVSLNWHTRWPKNLIHLAHNRAEYDNPDLPAWLSEAGHPLVTISEMKADSWRQAGYTRPISVIPPGIPADEFGPWIGDDQHILTVANNLRRPLFDLDAWLEATKDLPTILVGEDNEGLPGAIGPARDFAHLKTLYASCRVYLSVNKYPQEDPYNLALLEAMMTGMPVVTLAPSGEPRSFPGTYPPSMLRGALLFRLYRSPETLAAESANDHAYVCREFPFDRFRRQWRDVLTSR